MKRTVAVIQSSRFSAEWPGVPQEDTPPGQDFAQALLSHLIQQGAVSRSPRVADDHWDNGFWELAFSWEKIGYWIFLEAGYDESPVPTWYVRIEKMLGCLIPFFGRNEKRAEVSDSLLETVQAYLSTMADSCEVSWLTFFEYADAFS